MFHPLIDPPANLKDVDLESKILDLSRKYHITARMGQGSACQQISIILEMYQDEQRQRHAQAAQNMIKKQNKGLDDLINVN
jgi:hypothetical protein